jgi:hypothetical protein
MEVTKRYVVVNGVGHYEVSNGIHTISCDIPEVQYAERELHNELVELHII